MSDRVGEMRKFYQYFGMTSQTEDAWKKYMDNDPRKKNMEHTNTPWNNLTLPKKN